MVKKYFKKSKKKQGFCGSEFKNIKKLICCFALITNLTK